MRRSRLASVYTVIATLGLLLVPTLVTVLGRRSSR